MVHTIETLRERAERSGQTLEEVVASWLAERAEAGDDHALLRLAGVVDSDLTDVAERHDDYIGQALADALKPDGETKLFADTAGQSRSC